MDILAKFKELASKKNGRIIFAEGDEERTLKAAEKLIKDKVCKVSLVSSDISNIKDEARKNNINLDGIDLLEPDISLIEQDVLNNFVNNLEIKGTKRDEALSLAKEPLTFSALYVKSKKATGCVAGARASTPDVIKAAIRGIGPAPGTKLISSFFLMIPPDNHPVINKPIIYSDCGVNPDPGSMGLRDIAIASVESFRSLFPEEKPIVVFLSFSTKGSAKHKILNKIIEAVEITKEYFRDDKSIIIDGEFQFDAAVIPSVALKKAPDSPIKGNANIFIFPDLNSGNICYKVTERLGRFTAIGPLLQGLAMPMNDLSRGCSPEDIYYAAIIALLKGK